MKSALSLLTHLILFVLSIGIYPLHSYADGEAFKLDVAKGSTQLAGIVKNRKEQGYYLRNIGACGSANAEKTYLLTWYKSTASHEVAVNLSLTQMESKIQEMDKKGMHPTTLTQVVEGTDAKFHIVFSKYINFTGIQNALLGNGNDEGSFNQLINNSRSAGLNDVIRPVYVSREVSGVVSKYSAGFTTDNISRNWNVYTSLTDSQMVEMYYAYRKGMIFPEQMQLSEDGLYNVVFTDARTGGRTFTNHSSIENLKQAFEQKVLQGKSILGADCSGDVGSAKFKSFILYSEKMTVAPKSFSASGPGPAELTLKIDNFVKSIMAQSPMRYATVAITKGGKLVMARAYNSVELGEKTVTTNSPFRTASITKPITSIAIHQLIQEQKLNFTTPIQSLLKFTLPNGRPFRDQRIDHIQIRHLINHTGGWDRGFKSDIPYIPGVAAAYKKQMPITRNEMISIKLGEGLEFAPGAKQVYSNLGYAILGSVIEKISGKSYQSYVQDRIFRPLGINADIPTGYIEDTKAGEPLYSDVWARLGPSWADSSGKLLLMDYNAEGDLKLGDSFGGWRLRAVDYAKVLAHLRQIETSKANPTNAILSHDTVVDFFKPMDNAFPATLHGFWVSSAGNGITCRGHGGAFAGLNTDVCLRSDGIGFVMMFARSGVTINKAILNQILTEEVSKIDPGVDYFKDFGL